jgi:hypothetical protein
MSSNTWSLITNEVFEFSLRTQQTYNMSGNSSVGQASVYEAGDQRNYKQSEINKSEPYNEGKTNSHDTLDSSEFGFDDPAVPVYRDMLLTTLQRMSDPLRTD